jgi:hypothetical protein
MKRWVSGVELVIQSMEYEYRGYIYPFAAHSRARSKCSSSTYMGSNASLLAEPKSGMWSVEPALRQIGAVKKSWHFDGDTPPFPVSTFNCPSFPKSA